MSFSIQMLHFGLALFSRLCYYSSLDTELILKFIKQMKAEVADSAYPSKSVDSN